MNTKAQKNSAPKAFSFLKSVKDEQMQDLVLSQSEKELLKKIQHSPSFKILLTQIPDIKKSLLKSNLLHLAHKIKRHINPSLSQKLINFIFKYKKIWIGIILGSLLLVLALRFSPLQENLIFPGAWSLKEHGNDENLEFFTGSKSGTKLSYKYCEKQNNGKSILYFNGNGSTSASHRKVELQQMSIIYGANIYLFDYPGYGRSEGSIRSEAGFYQAVEDFYTHIKEKRKDDKLFVMGWSLGGTAAIHLANKYSPSGLIVRSTFTKIHDVVGILFKPLAYMVLRYQLDNLEKIAKVECPILLLHGIQDKVINVKHGERLYNACNGKRDFVTYDGDHNDPPPALFYQSVQKFIVIN